MTAAEQECFREGLDIGDDTLTKPAELEILSSGLESEVLLTITERTFPPGEADVPGGRHGSPLPEAPLHGTSAPG